MPSNAPSGDATTSRWLEEARRLDLPEPDSSPLRLGDTEVPMVWRSHYVAALLAEPASDAIIGALEDKGFAVFVFGSSAEEWSVVFSELETALGRAR